jgi:hypothetical protein
MTDQFNPQSGQPDSETIPHSAEGFGKIPQPSESFGNVPKASEAFRTVPKDSERFRSVPHPSERKENHTLTVREAARMFEAAGVARTERSLVNWCQRDAQGFGKLDAYYDTNERRYFITPQSVEAAIAEEKAKATKTGHEASETSGSVPNSPEKGQEETHSEPTRSEDTGRLKSLEQEILDLRIMNKGKDYFIDQLKEERKSLVAEQHTYVERLVSVSQQIGELKTKLLHSGTVEKTSTNEFSSPNSDAGIQ